MYSNALPTDAEVVFKDLIPWWLASITPPIYPSNCSASPFCPPFLSVFLSHFFFLPLLNDFILSFIFFPVRHIATLFPHSWTLIFACHLHNNVPKRTRSKRKRDKERPQLYGAFDTVWVTCSIYSIGPTGLAHHTSLQYTVDTVHYADGCLGTSFSLVHAY